jgi:hypothetical protein
MESPEDLEKALSRLMPVAISEDGKRSLDELIDRLSAGEEVVEMPKKLARPWAWVGAISAVAAAVVVTLNFQPGVSSPQNAVTTTPPTSEKNGIVMIQQTERIETAVAEDFVSETDGVAHRAWRVRVVGEERLQDMETGHEIVVSLPRDEVILMPVTDF